MKEKEKRGLLILIIVAIAIITTLAIITNIKGKEVNSDSTEENKVVEEFVQVLEDGTKLNTSTKLSETKTVDGLKIGNIQLTMQNGQSVLLADVENDTGKDIDIMLLDIILLDKNGNELTTIAGIVGDLKAGEKQQLNSSVTSDYANAYDFKVVIK
mgnify:FL=1